MSKRMGSIIGSCENIPNIPKYIIILIGAQRIRPNVKLYKDKPHNISIKNKTLNPTLFILLIFQFNPGCDFNRNGKSELNGLINKLFSKFQPLNLFIKSWFIFIFLLRLNQAGFQLYMVTLNKE
ncbi:MAG TPA: hypothetical protein VMG13_26945 [Trebonia sp.]|nr:hypothetical protein [Trebonia sp.]